MEQELEIVGIREDINKLKATVAVLLSVLEENKNLREEIKKLHLYKKTVWDENKEIDMQMKGFEEQHLQEHLKTYDELFGQIKV